MQACPPVAHWPPNATLPLQQGCGVTIMNSENALRVGLVYRFCISTPFVIGSHQVHPLHRAGIIGSEEAS